ncbi:M1 family metallopeptidase [Xanthomonas sp. 1678]|uniref:M1 family metallopeptidase n=1 Tax=Xanthomonas sp. 1678 TaxID=3158788 RepID=UPI0028571DC8|nr:alanyl aminopeptidase [Xanthomonas translucens]
MARLSLSSLPSVLALCCGAAFAQAPDAVPSGRLPSWAVPQHYALDLKIDPAQRTFSGTATIRVRLAQASDHLWLHGKQLRVAKATLRTATGTPFAVRYAQADAQAGVARIAFGRVLQPQELTLTIAYSAPLNQQLQGLYQVRYQGHAYALTQMEPISARYAFPGFDEPSLKTPFALRLTVPEADQALANTQAVATSPAGKGWKTVRFAETEPLPTYLVAYGVGPWDVVDAPALPATPQRAHATPLRGVTAQGQGPRIRRALEQTPAIITALEDYYGFGYPFDKLDLVAAPDFSAGAMENPGFVTFRDWLLLLDEDSPRRNVQGSFNVTAHELAHQWTGDTVTMTWWDDLWLNEAFATWMQQKITMQLRPEYRADLDRVASAQTAMDNDSLVSARKIRQPITGNGDIETAFDSITYKKGAAVLGMFEAFVGADTFRTGMRSYIAAHRFGNATADDLIDAIAVAAGKGDDFKAAFRSFLDQPGVPYVQARLEPGRQGAVLRLQQQRYLPLGSSGEGARSWGLPVCVKYGTAQGARRACTMLSGADGSIVLQGADKNSWVLPNAEGAGYYRFGLPKAQLDALGRHLDALGDAEKLAYADAIDAAFRRGDADSADVVAAMQRLAPAPAAPVATALVDRFGWIWRVLATDDAQRAALRSQAEQAFGARLQALGYRRRASDSADDVALRTDLASLLGVELGVPAVRQALLAQGDAVLAGSNGRGPDFAAADPDLLGSALAVAVQERGDAAVDALLAALRSHGEPAQRNAMIAALSMVRDPRQLQKVRDFALTDAVKVGEMTSLLMGAHADAATHASMWSWYTTHFDRLVARSGSFDGGRLPALAASGGCEVAEAERLEAFFAPRLQQLSGADRGLAQTAETIRLCSALRQQQRAAPLVR